MILQVYFVWGYREHPILTYNGMTFFASLFIYDLFCNPQSTSSFPIMVFSTKLTMFDWEILFNCRCQSKDM